MPDEAEGRMVKGRSIRPLESTNCLCELIDDDDGSVSNRQRSSSFSLLFSRVSAILLREEGSSLMFGACESSSNSVEMEVSSVCARIHACEI